MTLFLTDENISPTIVQFLRGRGFSVKDVAEEGMSGVDDAAIMNFARQEGRALITFDKHFANILLYPPSSHCGVVRIRLHPPLLTVVNRDLRLLLEEEA
jgi:predicted nuclease of predicted toxin-antitoxin system